MKIKTIIILGGHIQALGLSRQAHRLGVKVILLLQNSFSVARFSNTVNEVLVCSNIMQLKEVLLPYVGKQTLLFPTSDEYIEFLSENFHELSSKYVLGIPKPNCVRIFLNKRKTYQFAERYGIPHPKSWYPNNMNDIRKISRTADYPLVIDMVCRPYNR